MEQEVCRAAGIRGPEDDHAGQFDWAKDQGVVALAPVPRHIEGVQLVGIARLRYRPKTNRTRLFGREAEWREVIARYGQIAANTSTSASGAPFATSRVHQG